MPNPGATSGPSARGLFRQELGGEARTLRSVFRNLADPAGGASLLRDPRNGVLQARVDLTQPGDSGFWRFLAVRDDILAVITECVFAEARVERVPEEGLIEFHFVLGKAVEISTPSNSDRTLSEATLIACSNGAGMEYAVHCAPGPTTMIGLYVEPALLRESFGFGDDPGADMRKLLEPQPGTVTVLEQRIDPDVVQSLTTLRAIAFTERRDLVLAAARLYELLYAITSALRRRKDVDDPRVVFTERELAMFERARDLLSTDLARTLRLSGLARECGTNATKLKSGFKLLYGTTVFHYRLRLRLETAMRLLLERSLPISEVARAVGYGRQASFTSAFKAHFGLVPKAARRLGGAAPPNGRQRDADPPHG